MASILNFNSGANTFLERSNTYNSYMEDIRKIPLLDKEKERKLIVEYATTKDEKEKIRIRNILVKHNQRFVAAAAKLFANNNVDVFLDLVNEANMAFMKAIDDYDHRKTNNRLLSWAAWYMRRAMNTYLIKNKNMVRQSYDFLMHNQLTNARRILTQEKQREVTDDEIVEYLSEVKKLPVKDRKDVMQIQVNSIDVPVDDETEYNKYMYDYNISTASKNETYNSIASDDNKVLIKAAMSALNEREKKIFSMLYGLDGQMIESSMDTVAKEINCSNERVRQLHEKGLKKMGERLKEYLKHSY